MIKWILKMEAFFISKIHCLSIILSGFFLSFIFNKDFNWVSISILHGFLSIFSLLFIFILELIFLCFQVDISLTRKNSMKRKFSLFPIGEIGIRILAQIVNLIITDIYLNAFITWLALTLFYLIYAKNVCDLTFYNKTKINTFFVLYLLFSAFAGISLIISIFFNLISKNRLWNFHFIFWIYIYNYNSFRKQK